MKYRKINKEFLYIVILIIFLIQIVLIGHRNSFSFNIIKNFYKENAGLEEGIKNKEIYDIIKIIKKNNLKDFKLSENLFKSAKIKQRVFEGSYPSRHIKDSKNLITKLPKSTCDIKEKNKNIYLIICE
tara:strand:+ start:300 stop:683 length:384 start_codon:yes stop_codon:yes gene_type:complete